VRRPALKRVALLALLFPLAAAAQDVPRAERLYLNSSGVLLGSTRVIALGGAYVGVAEGVAGFSSNLAALAHRSPHLNRPWDVGFTLSWLDVPFLAPQSRDLDNDGEADRAQSTRQLLGGVMLQYKRFGIGWYFRSTSLSYCKLEGVECPSDHDRVYIDVANTALAGAVALGRDDFIIALGLYGAEATFSSAGQKRQYGDTGVEFDVLFRPHGLNYRVGVSVKPQVVAKYHEREGDAVTLAERRLYSAVVSPAVLSLGGSMRLGEGSGNYNRLSPATRQDILERFGEAWVPGDVPDDAPAGRWLITTQLDLISPTESTVPISSFVDLGVELGLREPELVGRESYVVPRLGAEHESIPGRLRTRLGTFLEPSPYRDHLPRPHLTGGLELFLFEYFDKWAASTSFDFARGYYNIGLSVGFWR
jgi:hypothetical protein